MVSYIERSLDITADVVILPGFNEGLSRRGGWFAHTLEIRSLLRKFRSGKKHSLRYLVYEPDSPAPLSDAEINHLMFDITSSLDQYRSMLERLEMQFRDIRKRGKLNAFIYILGILTVRWYWWIFLTRGEMSFNNGLNASDLERVSRTDSLVSRFWERGNSAAVITVLGEIKKLYDELNGEPLEKYRLLRNYALEKAGEEGLSSATSEAWMKVARGYRAVIKKLTGKSLLTEMLPTTFAGRLLFFFQRSYRVPEPECLYSVRNLSLPVDLQSVDYLDRGTRIIGRNSLEGNIMEIYALASKSGPPICIPTTQAMQLSQILSRADNIRRTDCNLEIFLHVGTEEERKGLLGIEYSKDISDGKKSALMARLQNASLDTNRQNEALIGYYLKQQLPVMLRTFQVQYPFRSRLHSLFPWLFITNGIPIASVLAGVWLFIDPYYNVKYQTEYDRYFSRILEGVDWSYHNLTIRVETDPALGYINSRIREDPDGKAYREISAETGRYGLPVSVTDRLILNNLTTETGQLEDFRREANNFTTIPLYFFRDGSHGDRSIDSFQDLCRKEGL